jgi:MSHA biogenesis protein MshP
VRTQQGVSLVSALFLIVVIAALGAFAVRISAGQQHTVNLSLLSSQALAAANAGVEWAARRALEEGGCAAATTQTLTLTEGALADFTVAVTCTPTTHADGGGSTTIYSITAFAQRGVYGAPDYVSRQIRARFSSV